MRNVFSGYHPVVNALYFLEVLSFTVCWMHPAALVISVLCAAAYAVCALGARTVARRMLWMVPILLLAAALNPAFNHRGATTLAYLPSGNPLTLESMAYGLAAAALLGAALLWCGCLHAVLSSDKILYLLGRAAPALSLVLSMSLGFIPRFRDQARRIAAGQRSLGRSGGTPFQKARNGIRCFSILVTWALETSVETADALSGRGYGLPGRTTFHLFRFDSRDQRALAFLLCAGVYVLAGVLSGSLAWRWFPVMRGAVPGAYGISVLAAYGMLCCLPLILEGREVRAWKRSISSI